ncbi:MAG: hypothetical protein KJ941_11655 [Bacteroidetes bacterium]|nr:hypothetical protein [Bacteroidota bacterium]
MSKILESRTLAFDLVAIVAIAAFICTAYFSHGFYQADEHYQIIEFAGFKLGTHQANDLPWEFAAQMRSTLQPTICAGILKVANFFHINDPYSQTFFLRCITACFALFVIRHFVRKTSSMIETNNQKVIYWILSFSLWFTPFISVRFSSETLSGLFLLLALTFCFEKEDSLKKNVFLGMLLGIGFLLRFQLAFAFVGIILWLLVIAKIQWRSLLIISVSFTLVLLLGVLIDTWFYGNWVFTPWNYFHQNIIQDAASFYGRSPWYFYIEKMIYAPTVIIGVLIALSLVLILLFKPRNLIIWIIIPYVIGHSLVAHKEERFLFPLIYLFPLILMLGNKILVSLFDKKRIIIIFTGICFTLICAVNAIGLTAMMFKPAGIGRSGITKHIHQNYSEQEVNLIYFVWANPYNPWLVLPMKFYQEKELSEKRIDDWSELKDLAIDDSKVNLLVIRKANRGNIELDSLLKNHAIVFEKQSVAPWLVDLNEYYQGFISEDVLELYKIVKKR